MKRLLIANRGEIAQRIARTCQRMGIEFVAVYSDADAHTPLVRQAHAAVHIGPSPAIESYLNGARLIEAAKTTGCDAIHPGYGFLSENPGFAKDVEAAGLVFVGPRAQTIADLGDKARAKRLMRDAGVPTVPGLPDASDDPAEIARLVRDIGFPVLLKPSAGGGGKGMQVVETEDQLLPAIEQGIRLARANFKDGRLLAERFVARPRHIEVQIFGDPQGNVVHVFERECSLQRRHQKVVEEAPALSLSPSVRQALLDAAVRGARALGYVNAGTFEFIVAEDGSFYFLEVNTRLQVEHPVSEEISGLDFVEWQLRIADGQAIPLRQEAITATGHAIECRVYAEDAANGFRPSPGRILALRWPAGTRVETGVEAGSEVTPFYDPMIAKLVVHGANRDAALQCMRQSLSDCTILGLTTNLGYLAHTLSDPAVQANRIFTAYLDQQLAGYCEQRDGAAAVACAAAIEHAQTHPARDAGDWPWGRQAGHGLVDRASLHPQEPMGSFHFWDGVQRRSAALLDQGGHATRLRCGTRSFDVAMLPRAPADLWHGTVNGTRWFALPAHGGLEIQVGGERAQLLPHAAHDPSRTTAEGEAVAPMPGVVVALNVAVGDTVRAGDTLAIVEAMKMENRVVASFDGTVEAVHTALASPVVAGAVLVTVTKAGATAEAV
ncbi:acetyl/propionyl/methylcrotonyl-CoA carboxylase subunit alpha [Hydrogenophaga sp. BPS33]|uniref:acetyl/propionyl/methylcrotonyl-CoA carboxylase subunit alpha n=1 Tax=Hydrogenophaga sp. BPS33 TaxID=2651974 RepID=UPI00131FF9F3|nr:biotin carboxylase N-terminal domain-containing protein [Hydrogenophaga sp. BPS33]QHE83428.1 ATP-grasp domain-containing protein [Hydrogenophaga sp. BPS33]